MSADQAHCAEVGSRTAMNRDANDGVGGHRCIASMDTYRYSHKEQKVHQQKNAVALPSFFKFFALFPLITKETWDSCESMIRRADIEGSKSKEEADKLSHRSLVVAAPLSLRSHSWCGWRPRTIGKSVWTKVIKTNKRRHQYAKFCSVSTSQSRLRCPTGLSTNG